MRIKLKVTEDHICKGTAGPLNCPISRALKETLGVGFALVSERIITPNKRFKHTRRSRRFMKKVDAGEKVNPTTFILEEVPNDY